MKKTYNTNPYQSQSYIINLAEKYHLYQYIRFNSHVDGAHWDDTTRCWKTAVRITNSKDAEYHQSYTISTDFLVSAVGQLNLPSYPSIPGLDSYGGKVMHSARWNWTYDYRGKRVAVIGNG